MIVQSFLEQTQTSKIQLDNHEIIIYNELGKQYMNQGPSLLFIHGLFSSKQAWEETINILKIKRKYHIIAVDLRGYGDSSYNKRCSQIQDWAQDLKQFCKKIHIQKCIAIGWSNGGIISMKLAQIAPQLITKLILTCTVSWGGLKFPNPDQLKSQLQSGDRKSSEKYFIQQIQPFIKRKDYNLINYQKSITGSLKQNKNCYQDAIQAMINPKIDCKNIIARALIIHGKKDSLINYQQIQANFEQYKNFKMDLKENNGHMIPVEDPETYALDIINFVQNE